MRDKCQIGNKLEIVETFFVVIGSSVTVFVNLAIRDKSIKARAHLQKIVQFEYRNHTAGHKLVCPELGVVVENAVLRWGERRSLHHCRLVALRQSPCRVEELRIGSQGEKFAYVEIVAARVAYLQPRQELLVIAHINVSAVLLFSHNKLRNESEYQLLYITKGKGTFSSTSGGQTEIQEGHMFLLFPGEWHTYRPDSETGWDEYWIGFNGKIIDEWVDNGFFSKQDPIFNIGLNEEVISLYKRAIIIAQAQEANYQQALSGIACNLISMAIYLSRNRDFNKSDIASKINQAKIAVHNNINKISPEELARITCMSYSRFRKTFKEYTGFAPSQYIQEVRINMAKEMLTNTSKSTKEIAFELGFENKEYFFAVFKRITKMTPSNYRNYTQGRQVSQISHL